MKNTTKLTYLLYLVLVTFICCREVNDKKAKNWFKARCEPLCDDQKGKFLDIEKLKKYKTMYPYDTVQIVNQDSVTISFDFITDCCLDFEGDATLRSDTLLLQYCYAADTMSPCDCYCDYRMIYNIYSGKRNWTSIKIVNTDVPNY
jgi:hypothetical protein